MEEMSAAQEMAVDAASPAANKTLTGELATAEKIAAYHIELPPLTFGQKVITFIELIGMVYLLYITVSFMHKHISHILGVLGLTGGHH